MFDIFATQTCVVYDVTETVLGTKWQHLRSWFCDIQTLVLNEQDEKTIEKLPCLFLIALISVDRARDVSSVQFLFCNDVTVSVDWLHLVKNYVHVPFQ